MGRTKKIISFAIVLAMVLQCCIYGNLTLEVRASEAAVVEEKEEVKENGSEEQGEPEESEEQEEAESEAEEENVTETGNEAETEQPLQKAEQALASGANEAANSVPEITSVKLLNTGEIYSNTDIQFEVGYQGGEADIKEIRLVFNDRSCSTDYGIELGKAGTTILKMSGHGQQHTVGEHHLKTISITDTTGNIIRYDYNESTGKYIANDANGAEHSLKIDECSFVVQYYPYKGLELKSLKIEEGIEKDKLVAGDSFEMIATLKNTSDSVQIVRPGTCLASWWIPEARNHIEVYGSGSNYSLNPGEEGKVHFQVSLNPYMSAGKIEFEKLEINRHNFQAEIRYWRLTNRNKLDVSDSSSVKIGSLDYNEEIDFTVSASEKEDTEAPYIESVLINSSNIKTPGKVSFDVKVSEEGHAKVKYLRFVFEDKERPRNGFSLSTEESGALSYSNEKACYVFTAELDKSVVEGVYNLTFITLQDEADNIRQYSKRNGELIETDSGNSLTSVCNLEVAESESQDYDFDIPVLNDCAALNGNVTAGDKIQYKINITDASGLSKVILEYSDGFTLTSNKIIKSGEGYLCDFIVDKYSKNSTHDLTYITLQDGSIHRNEAIYSYSKKDSMFSYYLPTHYPYTANVQGDFSLTIQQSQDIVLADNNADSLGQAIEAAGEKETIVIKDSNNEDRPDIILSAAFLEKAKEKEATLVIPDKNNFSELVINGSELSQIPQSGIRLSISRDVLTSKEILISGEADNIYYPVDVTTTDTSIPVTIRIKLDGEFIKLCGKNPIRISGVNEDGTTVLLKDNLTAGQDGYVELTFENGLSGGIVSRSLDSGKEGVSIKSAGNGNFAFVVSSRIADYVLGDINGDGDIKMADLMMCLHHVSGRTLLSGTQFAAADINGDGQIAMADLMKLLHYVSGRNKELQ